MKKILACFVLVLLLKHLPAQSTFCLSFANQTAAGGNFDVTLRMYSSDGNFQLGSSNFVFTYNTAALSNPVFLSSPLSGSVYDLATPSLVVTAPATGQVSFNAMYDGANGGGTTVPTAGLDMVVVRFTVVNNTLPTNLTWLYDGGTTKTVVFDDDNATQIFRTAGEGCAPRLNAKAFFDNGYNLTNNLMNDGLRANNKIPLNQPYNTLTFTGTYGMAAYNGTEVTTNPVLSVTGADAIVDWVILELRNAATPSTVEARRAALIQRDGDIVDVDGVSPVRFPTLTLEGNYHVVVRHRLCLATRTQTALQFNTGGVTPLNLTNNTNALANSLAPVTVGANTVYMMYVGDCDRNGFILSPEINLIRGMLNTIPANINYFTKNLDLTFDAFILTSDITALRKNLNKFQVNLNQ